MSALEITSSKTRNRTRGGRRGLGLTIFCMGGGNLKGKEASRNAGGKQDIGEEDGSLENPRA